MKDSIEGAYFDVEDKKMLASNLAASLNIPPDITITAVSVPAKPMTPPPVPKYGNHNTLHLSSSNHQIPMNLMVNSPQTMNNQNLPSVSNQSPLNLNTASNSNNVSSPMNASLNSASNQPVNVSSVSSQSNDNQSAQNTAPAPGNSKYTQLLDVIEEIGKDIRPTYSGSKSSAERLRRSIGLARILIRQCIMETEPNNKQ